MIFNIISRRPVMTRLSGWLCLLLALIAVSWLRAGDITSISEVRCVVETCFKQRSAALPNNTLVHQTDASAVWLVVLFDLDNVLIHPSDASRIGGEQWFSAIFKKGLALGLKKEQFWGALLEEFFNLQQRIELALVEPSVAVPLIKHLQSLPGVAVMGLTARSVAISDRTVAELNRLGIDFSKGVFCDKGHEQTYLGLGEPACFRDGIMFCGGSKKADILRRVLTDVHCSPTNIIFTDDRADNINALSVAAEQWGCHFEGLRYAGLDEEVKKFTLSKEWQAWIENLYSRHCPNVSSNIGAECKPA